MINTDLTNAQAYGRDAAHAVDIAAKELARLASRLQELRPALEKGDGKATHYAAEIVSEFTQGVGNIGVRLWSIVTYAGDADIEYQKSVHAHLA